MRHVWIASATASDVVQPEAGFEPCGEERALLSHGEVHEVAEQAALLDEAGKAGLSREVPPAITHHLPERRSHGEKPGPQGASDTTNVNSAVQLQDVSFEECVLPLFGAEVLKEHIGDDATLAKSERGAGNRSGVDHEPSATGRQAPSMNCPSLFALT